MLPELMLIPPTTPAVNETARRLFASCGFRLSTIEMLIEVISH
jgi:hypothetical protein